MKLRVAALLAAIAFVVAASGALYYASSPAKETPRKEVPVVQFQDGAGRPRSLADFRGKTVLLNIWATWCAPCREEMPALDRLQAKLGGSGFEVVALSIDRQGAEVVQKFYAEIGIKTLRIYVDSSMTAMSKLGVVGVPTTILIDPEGREIGRRAGPAKWDAPQTLEELERLLQGAARG